ncbi:MULTISPECIES: acetate/propionate family kinase [Brevundimonas]|jgi:acetate kinase|uniref:acetate/propionate family kinase n=1 Tax=Brevundimonas sp. P7753 TaxID=2726982 RepID=UPI0015C19BCD|nr:MULTISPECIES: acetate/propionate family kinase [Brevundimonas]NWE53545.1 acetate/propionate family kinase [Brevundimonas sp. P7753]
MSRDAILIMNAGSSSLKFAFYGADDLSVQARGALDTAGGTVRLRSLEGQMADAFHARALSVHGDINAQVGWILDTVRQDLPLTLVGAGHRVVHGGPAFHEPVLLDEAIIRTLTLLTPLAPAHQPHNLAGVEAVSQVWPDLPQVACFDTGFHHTQDRLAQLFPIPRALTDRGVIRYGFHGLSYEHIAARLPELLGERAEGRVIVAHLGNGASLCAMKNRRSIATTMGFTALDGLMMGTRAGAVDPGLVLWLISEQGMAPAEVSDMLNNKSGLLGVSGISNDVRELVKSNAPEAAEALDLFAYRIMRETGSLMAALGGLDAIVFTGGIGEHNPVVRGKVAERLAWAGVDLDPVRNFRNETVVSRDASAVTVLVEPANEELPIAEAVRRLLGAGEGVST